MWLIDMATLRQQYENYLFVNQDSKITFEEWERTVFIKKFENLPKQNIPDKKQTYNKLSIEKIGDNDYKILFQEKKLIGYAIRDIDGYYYFESCTQPNGFWSSYALRMVSDLLDEINSEHDNRIRDYFKKEENE